MSDTENPVVPDEVVVRYGVKELLALQGKTLERIETKVDANALAMAEAQGKLDLRMTLLESLNIGERLTSLERFRWGFPSLAGLSVLVSLGLLILYIVHWRT